VNWFVRRRSSTLPLQVFASIHRRQKAAVSSICLSLALAQHVRGSEHDSGDKRERAEKQHNVYGDLDHVTPQPVRPKYLLQAIP
jgi:hypothetical protein